MAGKNKLARNTTLSWDDNVPTARDLTGDLIADSLNGPGFTAGEIDMTGSSETVGNYFADRKENTITANIHANDTATTGASTVLNATVGVVGTLTIGFGEAGAAPVSTNLEWEGEYVLLSATLVVDGGKWVHNCTWRPSGAAAPAWGTVA